MAVPTVLYTTAIGSDEPIEELPAEIISYGYRLNRPGTIRFRLALDHPKCVSTVIFPGKHEIAVKRNQAVVWHGPVLAASETDTKTARDVAFAGEGLEHYLSRMHVTSKLAFSAATHDQFTIARTLVNHHQAKAGGDFGIDTSAVTTSGRKRDRVYESWERKNIGQAIIELAEVEDGFDFFIDPATRALELRYPQRGIRNDDLIWDERTIRSFNRGIDSTRQASQVLGVGAGEGADMLLSDLQDSVAVADYKLTQAPYTNKDVKIAATLLDHVRRELALMKNPAETIGITVGTAEPPLFSYEVGIEARIKWPSPYKAVNEYRRLVGFDVVWTQGEEQAVLFLEAIT